MSNREMRRPRRRVDPLVHADAEGNPILTRNGYRYKFHPKHHNRAKRGDARWHERITRPMEFKMFYEADDKSLVDDKGNYYNVCKRGDKYLEIGTRYENVAKFWKPTSGETHGYPVWPIKRESNHKRKEQDDHKRKEQDDIPPVAALRRMVEQGVITIEDMALLIKGDHIS